MSSFQAAVGLPPLSTLAAVTHEPDTVSGSGSGVASTIHPSSVSTASSGGPDYRDVRLKDPVPKKLKGRANDLNGFGVIQMDLGHEQALERGEVAKRASESSEQAAIRAYQSGYGASSVKRFVRVPDDDDSGTWDSYGSAAAQNTSHRAAAQTTTQSTSPVLRTQALNPNEAKAEQARLLDLLRSLPPLSVVDQICKALAFFGGIPDTAPPADSTAFPKSELANGSGTVFIGWLAEIFPRPPNETTFSKMANQPSHLSGLPSLTGDISVEGANASASAAGDAPRSEPSGNAQPAAGAVDAGSTEKRRRGRPKGSKATKVRRDKGIKKGPLKARKGTGDGDPSEAKELQHGLRPPNNDGTADDSWVDVDEDNILDVAGSVGSNFLFPTNTAPGPQGNGQAPPSSGVGDGAGAEPAQNLTENGKKRGRPKGSKNRPKPADADASTNKDVTAAAGFANVTPIPPPAVPNAGTTKKSNIGRPKGSTSKRTEASALPANQDATYDATSSATGHHLPGSSSDAASVASGNKRKRPKAAKHEAVSIDQGQGLAGGSHAGAPADLIHTGIAPSAKKQRKIGDARASVQNSVESASPATDTMVNTTSSGLGSAGPSLGSDDQIMPSLDTSGGATSDFAFDTLSSHLGQSTPTTLTNQHQHDHEQAMSSLRQQLPQQHRQQSQQQPLVAQKTMSSTPPFHGADGLQSLASGGRHQPQHLGQGPSSHQTNALPQVSGHAVSSTASQHSAQTQMSASLSSGSLTSQQLPRPSRTPQPFYASNRTGSNGQFGQPLPQPHQPQQQQQQQQEQQSQQKQQFASQYQPQGSYSSQQHQHQHQHQHQPHQQHQQHQQHQHQQGFAPQPRHPSQSMGSSSPGLLTPSTAHRSPQFGAPSATGLRNVAGTFGTSPSTGALSFGSSTYDQTRRQNPSGSPSLGSAYGPPGTGSHSLAHHASPSFGTSRPQHSPSASHAQNVSGSASGIQGFHGFDGSNIFDNMGLDPNANSNSGLNLGGPAGYMGGGVSRTSSNTGGFGPAPSINSFDASMGANMRDRFYGMRR